MADSDKLDDKAVEKPSNGPDPLTVIDKAIKAVPPVRYALGLAGIAAAAALIGIFVRGFTVNTAIVIVAVLVGMILLFVFSSLVMSGENSKSSKLAGMFLMWAITLLFVGTLGMTATAAGWGVPCNWAKLLNFPSRCDPQIGSVTQPSSTFCTASDENGKCVRCAFPIDLSGTAGSTVERHCPNMPASEDVNIGVSGTLSMTDRDDSSSDCWLTWGVERGAVHFSWDSTNNKSCSTPFANETGFVNGDGLDGGKFVLVRCQWGAHTDRTCKLDNGKMVVFTKKGQL